MWREGDLRQSRLERLGRKIWSRWGVENEEPREDRKEPRSGRHRQEKASRNRKQVEHT